jgi:hypothetical protein
MSDRTTSCPLSPATGPSTASPPSLSDAHRSPQVPGCVVSRLAVSVIAPSATASTRSGKTGRADVSSRTEE